MLSIIYEFFLIIGFDITPPGTFSELIVYVMQVFSAVGLVAAVFGLLGSMTLFLQSGGRRW